MTLRSALVVAAALGLLGLLGLNTFFQQDKLHGAGIEKIEWAAEWHAPLPGVRAMSVGPEGIVAIGDKTVALLGADGTVLRRYDRSPIAVGSTGDLDRDGAEEIVLASDGPAPTIEALDRTLTPLWSVTLAGAPPAARVLVVDFDGDGRREVLVGAGQILYALSGQGRLLWKHDVNPHGPGGADAVVRGLDDVGVAENGKKRHHVAFALQSGLFGVVAGDSGTVWQQMGEPVRRLRAVDLDGDGTSELIIGLENGAIGVWDAAGHSRTVNGLGEAVTEIRGVEVDGNPKTRELALGGKKGAVRVTRGPGAIFSANVAGKVSAIGGVDLDGDGRDEVFVGTEEGELAAFAPDGRPFGSVPAGGKVESIVGVVSVLRDRLAVVAAGPAVTAWRIAHRPAPAWYRPETGAAVGGLAVIASALVLLGLGARRPVATGPELDGRALREEVLAAAREQVVSLRAAGHARPDQANERLAQLERQLAKVRARDTQPPLSPRGSPPPPRRSE